MNSLFYLQLLTSFVLGGGFIALITFLAERAPVRIAGAIISMPGIVIFSYLFVGWATSAETVGKVAVTTLAGAGVVQMFAVVYMYASLIKIRSRIFSIILSATLAITTWLLLAYIVIALKISYLPIALAVWLPGVAISYYFLNIKNNIIFPEKIHRYTKKQIIFRALFSGFIIMLTVFLSKTLSPFWGGIFGAFPAGYLPAFAILHFFYGSPMLFKIGKNISVGSLCFVVYVVASHWSFPAFGLIGGTIVSFILSLAALFSIEYFTKPKN